VVRAPGETQAPELNITEQLPLVSQSPFAPVTATVSEGKFRACGFHPGEYRLKTARTEGSRSQRWSNAAPPD